MARRLLRYVGLEALDARVTIFDEGRTEVSDGYGRSSERHEGAAAWFAGIEDGVCLFGAEAGVVVVAAPVLSWGRRCRGRGGSPARSASCWR